MTPNIAVPIALIGWIPVILLMFAVLPHRTALVSAFLGAWLFLPVYAYKFSGIPEYSKTSATSLGVLLGVGIFDAKRFGALRVRWFDLPMLIWCIVPMASSTTAGFGVYDGLSGVVSQTVTWGIPYLIGRLWFGDLPGLKLLAIGLVVGGLVYIPFCLWEIRMSPGLHKWVYGYHQHSFAQTKRFGGFRPMVFMQHGLAVGMFMCMAALAAFALWLGRSVRGIAGMPMTWIFAALGATAVLCKSLGAIVLMFIGMLIVLAVKHQKSAAVLVLVLGLPLAYMGARTVGGWDGEELIELVGGEDGTHGHSIQFRVNSEKGVWALVQPNLLLGRARFSYRLDGTEFSNNQRIVGDSLWIGALGKYGLVGLCSLTAAFMVPPLLLIRRWHAATWSHPTLAPAAVLAIVITLSLFDNLFNAMLNPLFVVMMGALSGCCGDRSSAYVSAGSRFVPATVQPG